MTFNDIYPKWLSWKKRQVKESTLAAYQLQWKTRGEKYWGSLEIESIRSRHFQDWLEILLDEHTISLKTIQDYITTIKSILYWAWTYYELPVIPIKVAYPTTDNEEIDANSKKPKSLSPKDQEILVKYIMANPTHASIGILLTLCTGLRIGELCALKFSDIDFENHVINISRTLQRIMVWNESGDENYTKVIETSPKSRSSRRTIPLYGFVEKWLKNASKIANPDYYILTGNTKFIEPRTFRNYYKGVITEAGVQNIKFHGLRHTFATRLITSNVDFKTVSEILGHGDISMTLNIYSHPDENQKRSSAIKAFKSLGL